MAKDVTLKNNDGEELYPITRTTNVYNENNKTVEELLANIPDTSKFALKEDVPTDNSQLSNGADYSTNSALNQLKDVLEEKIEDLKQQGGGSEENWVEIYDCNSVDPAINWGYPDGLIGKTEVTTNLPNFLLYKKLRIYHKFANHYVSKEFDLSKLAQHIAKLPTAGYWLRFLESDSDTVKYTYASNAAILWKDRVIYKMMFSKTVKTAFPVNKYPIFTDYTSSYCAIQRIEGLPF